MANEETNNKFSSNLKVPPLKIVLSSHQNNTVVNISSNLDGSQFKSSDKDDNSNDNLEQEVGRRNGFDSVDSETKHHRRNQKGSSERNELDIGQTSSRAATFSSSSSSSSSSDRSSSTTPSSESESLASNSTIISEHQQVKTKSDNKEESSIARQEKTSRHSTKASSAERSTNSGPHGKKSHDNLEQSSETVTTSSREQTLNANQRITRSSQRAAQQSKTEHPNETNGDEPSVSENQDKTHESARKVKRRKGELQENEQDSVQAAAQPTVIMANICPADYQLPSQNSFELYRDIRKRPYKKLMKLSHIQPRIPHGFKDYLINGGPYLLDGNKLGVGLNGVKYDNSKTADHHSTTSSGAAANRIPLSMKLSNFHQRLSSHHPTHQRHSSYNIPKLSDAPKALQVGSTLHELFIDQEKARHQMRMQHLKERERSILTAEQEILRAYNKAAIADVKQKLHLSACTYFFYQERYHYHLDEKSGTNGGTTSKEVPHSQDNSFLCIEGGEAIIKTIDNNDRSVGDGPTASETTNKDCNKSPNEERNSSIESLTSDKVKELGQQVKKETNLNESVDSKIEDVEMTDSEVGETKEKDVPKNAQVASNGTNKFEANYSCSSDSVAMSTTKPKATIEGSSSKSAECSESEKLDDQVKNLDLDSDNSISDSANDKDDPTRGMSSEDLKNFNKELFLTQLQDIDDKWDKIKKDMFVRHKNESDSLHAVQTLEWEWKAKEIGACDVRVSLKIEPDFVPRVEVSTLDY